jgi:hypothetical protein
MGKRKKNSQADYEEEESIVVEVPARKSKKKKHQRNDEEEDIVEEVVNGNNEMESDTEVQPRKSKKKKKKQQRNDEEAVESHVEEAVNDSNNEGAEVSKKKRKTAHEVVESPTANGVVVDSSDQEEAPAKPRKKKRTMQKKREIVNENGGELSDIEKHYVTAVRVKVGDAGEFYRLNGRLADLETKVHDISEEECNPEDPLNMPPQGILIDGLPFHHCYPYPLKKHHIRRLYAHGIILKTKNFDAGEDEQIIENWKIYARKNGFDYEDAPIYCGWAKHLGYNLEMSMKKFHQKTKFFPYMCRGLIDRCAIQVYRRCYRIFDPRFDEFGKQHEEEWTPEDDRRLQELYNFEGPSWQKIAVQMRRNRFQVQTRYQRVICGEKPPQAPIQGKTKLLFIKDEDNLRGVIYEHAKNLLPVHPLVLVTKGIGEAEDRNIKWDELCKKYSNLTTVKCETEWTKIKAQLRAAYNRENNPSITFTAIEKIVFGTNPKKYHNLKPKIAEKAFKILHELAKEKEIEELWEIDASELTTRLKDAEIQFFTSYTLGSHILRTAHRILTSLKKFKFVTNFTRWNYRN